MAGRTRAATRAAAVEHAERALDVCLQQPAFRQPDDCMTISLLAVSKRLAELVAERCSGALALCAQVNTAAAATSLAAWLSRHGDLLAELTFHVAWHAAAVWPHPSARMLEQVPGSLRRLVLRDRNDDTTHYIEPDVEAEQAATLAATFSRQPMQLRQLVLPSSLRDQAATLLPALRQLRQLTSLVMWLPERSDQLSAQHVRHLPAQLQQLELFSFQYESHALSRLPWLALEHVTGLTSLSAPSVRVDGGALPHGLRALTVEGISTTVPVLQLEHLTALHLMDCRARVEQLRQLSTLQRLEQLSVTLAGAEHDADAEHDALSNAAPVLCALPLVALRSDEQALTAACVGHLGACTRLTRLQLRGCSLAPGVGPEQLAAMLSRLTALERYSNTPMELPADGEDTATDWAPVCQALARLPHLTACSLTGRKLGPAAVTQLAAATQLTELHLVACGLDDASVLALCSGLARLRRLDVTWNDSLTDGCLEGIATLRQLSWLRMHSVNVTEAGRQLLRAALPELQLT